MYSKRKTPKNFWLVILLLLSFKVTANVVNEAQDFLIELSNGEGFWFYNSSSPQTQQQIDALLKTHQLEPNEDLSVTIETKKSLFESVNQQIKFRENHALLLFAELEGQAPEQTVREFSNQYQLPLIVVNKKEGGFPLMIGESETPISLQNAFVRLNANFQDIFLLNPKKRQITLLSRSQHAYLLEQALFFELYKNLKDHEGIE